MTIDRARAVPAVLALGGLLALVASSARGQGVYVSAFGGLGMQTRQVSTEVVAGTGAPARQFAVRFDPGFLAGGGIGYAFADSGYGRFRIEAELGYRQNGVKKGTLDGNPIPFQGDDSSLAGILMIYYDLMGPSERLRPYVGAGVGLAGVESDATFALFGGPVRHLGGPTDTEIAWQVVGGIAVAIGRRFDLTIDGRYYATTNPSWTTDLATAGTGRFGSGFRTWHATAGFRFHF